MGKTYYRNDNSCAGKLRVIKKPETIRKVAAALTATLILITPFSHASAEENYAYDVYRQLVTEGSNTANFVYEGDTLTPNEVLAEVCKIDSEDNLYDGAMLRNRGNWTLMWKGNNYTLIVNNAYDIKEADLVTQTIADEIKELAGEDATDRELFYEYLKYMADNFKYSAEIGRAKTKWNRKGIDIDINNFCDAYYGDKKTDCAGYSSMTYLVARKLGIECEIIEGGLHVFNIVKFSDSDNYIAYDLTLQNKYSNLGIFANMLVKARSLFDKPENKMIAKACNGDNKYSAASVDEFVKMFRYYNGI